MIRVLLVHPALPPYRVDFFNAIGKDLQVRLLFLKENLSSQAFDQAALRGRLRTEHRFATQGVEWRRRVIRLGIGTAIEEFEPDVVVSPEFSPTTLQVIVKNCTGGRSFAHVVMTDDNPESIRRDTRARRAARRLAMRWIDGMVVLTRETASVYRSEYGARDPIGICPILREEVSFRQEVDAASEEGRRLVAQHGLQDRRVMLIVGRLVREKRVDRAITAFARLGLASRGAVLVIVGDGPERGGLEALARERGVGAATIFAGRLEGAPLLAWYRLGGLFLLPSEWEPFGAVVNEALLAGIPTICSAKAGARCLAEPGVNGAIVDWACDGDVDAAVSRWSNRAVPAGKVAARPLRPPMVPLSFSATVEEFARVVSEAADRKRFLRDGCGRP